MPGTLSDMKRTLGRLPRRDIVPILALGIGMGATEGAGLALLVPIVASAGDIGGAGLPSFPVFPLPALLVGFVAIISLRALAELWLRRRSFEVEVRFVDGLRDEAFARLLGAKWRSISAMRSGEYRATLISSVERCGDAVAHALAIVRLVATIASLLLVGLFLSPVALFVGLLAFAAIAVGFAPLHRKARRLGDRHGPQFDAIHSRLGESVDGVRLIKANRAEPRSRDAMAQAFSGLRALERRWLILSTRMRTGLQIVGSILLAVLAFWLLRTPSISLPVAVAIVALMVRFVPQAADLVAQTHHLAHSVPAFDEIDRLIARLSDAGEPSTETRDSPDFRRELVLSGIAISGRGGAQVLGGLNLHIPHGACIAITGQSGAGKSTLADILSGLVAPEAGVMAVDGIAIDDSNRPHWRSRVALLDQQPVVFGGTVRENLRFAASRASDDELETAIRSAQADFVLDWPDGLDTVVGDAGRMLSGGEKQRICLARALLTKPRLLILDEATSGVDPNTEIAIAASVAKLIGETTVIIIAHRGHLLELAQNRLRLVDGRLHPKPSLNDGFHPNSPRIHGISV